MKSELQLSQILATSCTNVNFFKVRKLILSQPKQLVFDIPNQHDVKFLPVESDLFLVFHENCVYFLSVLEASLWSIISERKQPTCLIPMANQVQNYHCEQVFVIFLSCPGSTNIAWRVTDHLQQTQYRLFPQVIFI